MKQFSLIVVVAGLASCASTATVSQPAESIEPVAAFTRAQETPDEAESSPVTVAVPDELPIHRVSIIMGGRGLDSGLWAPVESQFAFGVEYAQERPGSSVGWEAGAYFGIDTATVLPIDVESTTTELYGGVRKTFMDPAGRWHPYIGGGLSLINAEFKVGGASGDDSSLALYAHGGCLMDITESMYLGLDLRTLLGSSINIAGVDGDADYFQFAVMVGWAF